MLESDDFTNQPSLPTDDAEPANLGDLLAHAAPTRNTYMALSEEEMREREWRAAQPRAPRSTPTPPTARQRLLSMKPMRILIGVFVVMIIAVALLRIQPTPSAVSFSLTRTAMANDNYYPTPLPSTPVPTRVRGFTSDVVATTQPGIEAQKYWNQALQQMNDKQYSQARASLSHFMNMGGSRLAGYMMQARAAIGMEAYQMALSDLEWAAKLDRNNVAIMEMRGDVYFAMGKDYYAYAQYWYNAYTDSVGSQTPTMQANLKAME